MVELLFASSMEPVLYKLQIIVFEVSSLKQEVIATIYAGVNVDHNS